MSDAMMEAAQHLVQGGFHIFPVYEPKPDGSCSCEKSTCDSIGKHPRTARGFHEATTDEAQIKAWWSSWPTANIGIACRPSGVIVADVDPQNGGDTTYAMLIAKHGEFPVTRTADTGGGGFHLVFKNPGRKVRSPGRGIDVKDDGYIVAPPSLHRSGKHYAWRDVETPIVDLPGWMLQAAISTRTNAAAPFGSNVISEGSRNQVLTSVAGAMRHKGLSEETILTALLAHNAERCVPPLADDEVRAIAKSVARYEPVQSVSAPSTDKLKTFSWQELVAASVKDPPVQLVAELILKGGTAMIYSAPGVGKSLVAIELALAIERGEKFLGTYQCSRARVGYIDEESSERLLGSRLADISIAHNASLADDEPLPAFSVGGRAALDSDQGVQRISDWIDENQFEVLILDTLRRVASGMRENESDDTAKVHRALMYLRSTHRDLTIVILHHARKGGQGVDGAQMARGSSDLIAGIDSAFYLEKADATTFTFEHTKARWSKLAERFTVRIMESPGGGGIWLTHEGAAPSVKAESKSGAAQEAICEALKNAPNFTLTQQELKAIAADAAQASSNTAIKVLTRLTTKGVLSMSSATGKKTTYQLVAPTVKEF